MNTTRRDGAQTIVPPMDAAEIADALEIAKACRPRLIEKTGKWYWCDFETKPTDEQRAALTAAGWRWGNRKGRWYLPTVRSGNKKNVDMPYIREKYGSDLLNVRDESATPTRTSAPAPITAGLF